MYHKATFKSGKGVLFYRHNDIDSRRENLLCIHGLGDSGGVFREAFFEAGLRDYNIIVPDLCGYGESQSKVDSEEDYKFKNQIARLYELLDQLRIEKFFLIGHSMGGDIGTLMCTTYSQARIRAFVNVEGDLTQGDRFITNLAVAAHAQGDKFFEKWLKYELIDILFADERAKFTLSKKHYQKSLAACSAIAFWENVKEIRSLNENLPGHDYAETARLFTEIQIPKIYYWGTESIEPKSPTWKYLETNTFQQQSFSAFHWIMLGQRKEFYDCLTNFFRTIALAKG